jgi:hypothetical protein
MGLTFTSDKFSKNRVLLVDVDSIFCGKGKYSFFAVNASSPSVLYPVFVFVLFFFLFLFLFLFLICFFIMFFVFFYVFFFIFRIHQHAIYGNTEIIAHYVSSMK